MHGGARKALPTDLPPNSTVQISPNTGTRMARGIASIAREQEGREPSPIVVVVQSQTPKGSQGAWLDLAGYEARGYLKRSGPPLSRSACRAKAGR